MRHFDPACGQAFGSVEMLGLVQLFFGINPEADGFGLMFAVVALDDQAVVADLFQTAKVQGVGVALSQDQTDDLLVEIAAGFQIARGDDGMTGTGDVERWVVDRFWQWHGKSPTIRLKPSEISFVAQLEGASQPTGHVVPTNVEQQRQALLWPKFAVHGVPDL